MDPGMEQKWASAGSVHQLASAAAAGAVTSGPLHVHVSFRATWENSRLWLWMLERAELSVCSLALVFRDFSAKFQAPFDQFPINTTALVG